MVRPTRPATRVAVATTSLRMGGAERVAAEQAIRLDDEYDVTFLSLETPDSDFYPAPELDRTVIDDPAGPGGVRRRIDRLRGLRRFLRSRQVDVVLAHQDWLAMLFLVADIGPGRGRTKIVVLEHCDPLTTPPRRSLRWLRRVLYRRADRVVCLTRQGADWLSDHLGLPVADIPNPAPAPVRSEEDPAARQIDVIAVGRLEPHKHVELFISAIAELAARGIDVNAQILGDGVQRAELEELAATSGVDDRIEFTGAVSDVDQRLLQAKVYCLLSEREGHPMSLLEAMAHGCASISTDCRTGPREIIEHGVDGFLLDTHPTPAQVADAMAELLADPELQRRFSEAGLRKVEQLSPTEIDKRWTALIADLVEGTHPERS